MKSEVTLIWIRMAQSPSFALHVSHGALHDNGLVYAMSVAYDAKVTHGCFRLGEGNCGSRRRGRVCEGSPKGWYGDLIGDAAGRCARGASGSHPPQPLDAQCDTDARGRDLLHRGRAHPLGPGRGEPKRERAEQPAAGSAAR